MTKRTLRASIFMRAVQTGISAALTGTPNQSSCAPAESIPFMDATCSVSLQACMKPRHSALLQRKHTTVRGPQGIVEFPSQDVVRSAVCQSCVWEGRLSMAQAHNAPTSTP